MDPFELIFTVSICLFIFILAITWPRPIEEVRDSRNRLLFTIYQSGNGFRVYDHNGIFKRKIYFRTFVDVEAFVKRRINKWEELTR